MTCSLSGPAAKMPKPSPKIIHPPLIISAMIIGCPDSTLRLTVPNLTTKNSHSQGRPSLDLRSGYIREKSIQKICGACHLIFWPIAKYRKFCSTPPKGPPAKMPKASPKIMRSSLDHTAMIRVSGCTPRGYRYKI